MALNTELIVTLQRIRGMSNRTIFHINEAFTDDINSIEELCDNWGYLNDKKLAKIKSSDLYTANFIARRFIDTSLKNGIGLISICDDIFPLQLKKCINEKGTFDPPVVLYYRGNLKALEKPGIALIGSSEATENGEKASSYFSSKFAENGFNIVSGLGVGCDTAVHRGALKVDGTTTAILANGLDWDSIYPKNNLYLAKEIVSNGGLLLSEYPTGKTCDRYTLAARDRIQAGLSHALVAIQTGIYERAMDTVKATLQSKKPLFTVDYSQEQDLKHESVQGNIKMLKLGKAKSLTKNTFDNALASIKRQVEKLRVKYELSLS